MIILYYILISFICNAQIKYIIPINVKLKTLSEKYCASVIDVKEETGNNDGAIIESIIATGGGKKGYPYCYYYQYWAYEMATNEANNHFCCKFVNPLVKSGSSQALFNYAVNLNNKTFFKPQKHDFIVWKTSNSWAGHIERIKEVLGGGYVITYAANTSNGKSGSQREGNGIFLRKRNINHPLSRLLKIRGLIGNE